MITPNTGKNTIGIGWYDPVSYSELIYMVPRRWNKHYTSVYEGVTYYFRNWENEKAFDQNPVQYLPQYGGYCATAISEWQTAPIDPFTFRIEDNKLYLFYNDRWGNNTVNDRESNHDNRKTAADKHWNNQNIKDNGTGIVYSSRITWLKSFF